MEQGMRREERLATCSSSGPLRRQLGHTGLFPVGVLLPGPAGEVEFQKHSMCFGCNVMSSFDQKKKKKKSADD